MPILGDPGHAGIVHSLRTRVPSILNLNTPDAPRAIVLVTAHWTTEHPTISNAAKHELYYDYYGFPKEAYGLKYDAPGSSGVAREVFDVLRGIGMSPVMDGERGMFFNLAKFPAWFSANHEFQVGTTASSSP